MFKEQVGMLIGSTRREARTPRYWRNLILFTIGVVLLAIVVGGIWYTHQRAMNLVHPGRHLATTSPEQVGIVAWEPVTFETSDGLQLEGWFVPPAESMDGASMIFVHGWAGARDGLLDQAALVVEDGYGALLFDLRNHGASEGDVTTMGFQEVEDVRAALDYLASRPDVNPERIGLLGHSMGSAVVLRAGARLPQARLVVAESGYTSLEDNLAQAVRILAGLPPFPFAPLVVWFGERETGLQLDQVRPIEDIARLSPRPVLLIHGELDEIMLVENAYQLYEAAAEPKQLFILPRAGHADLMDVDPLGMADQILRFLNEYLLSP